MITVALLTVMLAQTPAADPVRFVQGKLEVPTYTFGRAEDVAPLFRSLENMGYYPYTIYDWNSRSRKPVPVSYESLVLENEYLRVVFLPELGGRIWSAYDKSAKKDLFYHTSVIKPARYNQRGAWPVGNLELYGPFDAHMLTYPGEPWAWSAFSGPDGSATVVLSHVDHFFRDKISLSVTLRPGKSYVETTIRLHNKNLVPNRYLLWTNAGVGVTEGSRFVYPMTRTIGHDSSALNTWPVIGGVDLSWNKNNKNMLGVFGLDIFDNFMSVYDYKTDFGTICFTNRLQARGMKTWTFGSGLTALRHMAAYTDSDGLYMETQSGRFVWDGNYEFIDPGKTDGWTEYWFGAGGLGGLTTASRDAAVFLDLPEKRTGTARLAVTGTGVFPASVVELWAGNEKIWTATQDVHVGSVARSTVALPESAGNEALNLRIRSAEGQVLLDHTIYPDGSHPNAVYASDSIPRKFGPPETLSAEETYEMGLAHEKFGQTDDAERDYQAALSKDPGFSQAHLRLGLLAMDRFQYEEALPHFDKVLERDPTNGDAHYFAGIIDAMAGRRLDARRHYYRLLPSTAKFERRDYMLAMISLAEGDWAEAAQGLGRAAFAAPGDISARQAYAYLSRKTGRPDVTQQELEAILKLDPTNAFVQAERNFSGAADAGALLDKACARHAQGYLELATEYMRLCAWEEAGKTLDRGIRTAQSAGESPYPLLYYYGAFAAARKGDEQAARQLLAEARGRQMRIDIFPFRFEDVQVLQYALKADRRDANAAALLGDLLYSRGRRNEAVALWRGAVAAVPDHFMALRDLGMAQLVDGDRKEGLDLLTRATVARPTHMATTMLVTNMHARLGDAAAARSALERALEKTPGSDALIEKMASVEAQLGNPGRALELLNSHTFEPTHQTYSLLHLFRGVRLMLALESAKKGDFQEALSHVRAAAAPPASLGIDDFATVASSRLLMFEALLQESAGHGSEAQAAWRAAAETRDDDVEGEGLFRAIALAKIGKSDAAQSWLKAFVPVNEQRKRDNSADVRIHAWCLAGYYAALQGDHARSAEQFRQALEVDQSYLYARQSLAWLTSGLLKFTK